MHSLVFPVEHDAVKYIFEQGASVVFKAIDPPELFHALLTYVLFDESFYADELIECHENIHDDVVSWMEDATISLWDSIQGIKNALNDAHLQHTDIADVTLSLVDDSIILFTEKPC